MILTATVIGEDLGNENNQKLIPYNDFLRKLAKQKKCKLADLNATFQKAIKADADKPGLKFTRDGVHMNPAGDQVMATDILQSFGLSKAQLKKAQESWREIH
jgi:lysophospholipase L1-like esterase